MPPMRGIAPLCLRRPPGSCTRPSRLPRRVVSGVRMSEMTNATPKTTANAASGAGRLSGSKLTIPCVAEARHDEADLVELLVNSGDVDGHVGVRLAHRHDALHRGDKPDEHDAPRAPPLEQAGRRRRRADSRPPRVEDQAANNRQDA